MTNTLSPTTTVPALVQPSADQWRRFVRTAAVGTLAATAAMMSVGRFIGPSLVVLDIILVAGLLRMRRGGRSGLVLIGVISAANLLLHAPIHWILVTNVESPASFVIGVAVTAASVLALAGVIVSWRGRSAASTLPRKLLTATAVLVVAAAVGGGVAYATRTSDAAQPGDILVRTTGSKVTPRTVEAPAGTFTLHLRNDDPISPRAFDLDDLGVHVVVPPNTSRRIDISAEAGRYEFRDQMTGTSATSGTLVVARASAEPAWCAPAAELANTHPAFEGEPRSEDVLAFIETEIAPRSRRLAATLPEEVADDGAIIVNAQQEAIAARELSGLDTPAVREAEATVNAYIRSTCGE